ncbi:MAG: CyaY protein [Candidatus Azotimanducaceae bacterium]|jgi:CyaY protein
MTHLSTQQESVALQDAEFHSLVDELVMQLEDELEEYPEDLDIENSAGILTIGFPNGSTIVVSRQIANHEIWVAAKSGGFHLAYKEGDWVCGTTKENLASLSSRVVTEQIGREVSLLG